MKLTSSAFGQEEMIPARFTCEGASVNPPLTVDDIPEQAQSLALIVDDPDAPAGTYVHWVVYDISVRDRIEENSVPGTQGLTSAGGEDYVGPCPPWGTHRYYFTCYALDKMLGLPSGRSKDQLLAGMKGHVLAEAQLMGRYRKQGKP